MLDPPPAADDLLRCDAQSNRPTILKRIGHAGASDAMWLRPDLDKCRAGNPALALYGYRTLAKSFAALPSNSSRES